MSLYHLRKFARSYTKDASASDTSQVVAAGATVSVYKQGATITNGTTITTGGVTVTVRDAGRLVVNDTVQLGTDATKQMLVTAIGSRTSLTVQSTTGSSISVSAGDRLVIYSNLPTLYTESTGVTTKTNPSATDSRGGFEFYSTEVAVDIILSGTGITSALYINEGGYQAMKQISADRGDASVTLTFPTDEEVQRFATTLTANRAVTLTTTNCLPGATFWVVRTGLGAFTLNVGGLKTIPASTAATVVVTFDGVAWRFAAYIPHSPETVFQPISANVGTVSADRGDTSPTLTYGTDSEIQRFATALTNNRTVTLSTTAAVNGSHFRIVRTGGGAFNLDVGGLKTIAGAPSAFVDVHYNGSAWVLTGYGLL